MESMQKTSCVSPSQLRLQYLLALDVLTDEELRGECRLPGHPHEGDRTPGQE